jgi:hypothetical protein
MAVLTGNQVVQVYSDGQSDHTALYALRNVTTADTADLSGEFSVVKRAVLLGTTVAGAVAASVSAGTVVTIPSGVASDGAWLLAWGVKA